QEHLDGGPGFDCWRDTHVRIEGEGAAVLQAVFLTDWYNATGEDIFTGDHFPLLLVLLHRGGDGLMLAA
ncbi:MAG TPA: hypothetical protein VK864_14210, partial [Longimicrobiales bacterium]|nr:hypothetical protein [Longimicrobiales bacterium]